MNDLFFTVISNSSNGFLRISYPSCIIKNINNVFYNLLKSEFKNIYTQTEIIDKNIYNALGVVDDEIVCTSIKTVMRNAVEKQNYTNINKFYINENEKFYKFSYEVISDNGLNKELLIMSTDITDVMIKRIEAERTLRKEEEFFINITHELKTPLNVIFSINQIMDLYLGQGSLNKNKGHFVKNNNLIRQNCYRLIRLVNNIIDLSKLESGNLKLQLINVDIVKLIKCIVSSVSEYIKDIGMNINFYSNVNEKIIAADVDKVERVLLNLLSNAIKFSEKGGKIDITLIDRDDFIELSVRDYGVGIEQEDINLIFRRYRQVENTYVKNKTGSGVGLSLVKSIVELHKGDIRVESELGKGSNFIINIPVYKVQCDYEKDVEFNCLNDKVERINIEFSDIYSI